MKCEKKRGIKDESQGNGMPLIEMGRLRKKQVLEIVVIWSLIFHVFR